MANERMHLSAAGYDALRAREGVVMHYYNDVAGNCTWGVGTLAHYGPCTAEEMQREVTETQVNSSLEARVQQAEQTVRSIVRDVALTQAQFDAAVSFAYNSSRENTRQALAPANRGDMAAVARHMLRNVYVHVRDGSGQPLEPPQLSQGLLNRRRQEQLPFLIGPAPGEPSLAAASPAAASPTEPPPGDPQART